MTGWQQAAALQRRLELQQRPELQQCFESRNKDLTANYSP